jgi:hypothetical protein
LRQINESGEVRSQTLHPTELRAQSGIFCGKAIINENPPFSERAQELGASSPFVRTGQQCRVQSAFPQRADRRVKIVRYDENPTRLESLATSCFQ